MFPGETPVQSCQRLLKRELGLDIGRERFTAVCAQAFAFGMREQVPKEHGTTDTQFCYKVQLKNEGEVKKVVVDEQEYCDSEWKLPSDILDGNYHPALKYAVGCMLAGEALEELQECEKNGGSDAEVAKLSRDFLKRRRAVDEVMKKNEYRLDSKEMNYQTTVRSTY